MEMSNSPTVEEVLNMKKPCDRFLKKLEDNIYGIRFIGFKIRDIDNGDVFHDFKADNKFDLDYFADHELNYNFPQKILTVKTIGTNLTFVVGDKEVKNLDFIERHYIDNELVGNFVFKFPFFMPNTENNIEFIYSMPNLTENSKKRLKNKQDVIARSDTFVFVKGELIIHRMANYKYTNC